jgi:hypothetical protein
MRAAAELVFPDRRLHGVFRMGMDPAKHDLIQAEFEAKLLANRQVPEDDPAEDHMNRVERLVVWWVAALVVFAGGVLWFAGDAAAVVGSVCLTAVALTVIAASRRPTARVSRS